MTLPLIIAHAGATGVLQAQSIEVKLHAGIRAPLDGALVVPVPEPAQVGFVSIPRRLEETTGTIVAATLRVPATRTIAIAVGVSSTFASRRAESAGVASCDPCATRVLGFNVGASVRRPVSERVRVEAAVGGEMLHLGGAAYDQPLNLRGAEVVPAKRTIPALIGSAGTRYRLPRGGAVSLDAHVRRYQIRSRWVDASLDATAGEIRSTPHVDLLLTAGWTPGTR